MIAVSKETGRKLAVCFQNRFNNSSIAMKEIIDSGRVGTIIGARASVTWSRSPKYYTGSDWRGKWATEGGGVLINQSIHTLDLMQWLLGPVSSLKAHIDRYTLAEYIEVEDTADVFFKFANGAKGLFYATNSYVANSPVEIEIICEKATMKLSDKLIVKFTDGAVEEYDDTIDRSDEKAYWGNSHRKLIESFYNSILNDVDFSVCGAQGIPTLKLIEAIYTSSASGAIVKL